MRQGATDDRLSLNCPFPGSSLLVMPITRIVSGGQTGADQGALDAAIYCDVPHGGWCPKGRKSEAGRIQSKQHLDSPFT
jgi:hypothetical protein